MAEYTTGDVDLKIHFQSEKNVTADDLLAEAGVIWNKVRAKSLPPGDDEAADNFMSETRKSHPQFCKSYPIVTKYMIYMQEYKQDAFKKYLLKISKHPWKNEGEYLDSQADYVVLLYKATHPRWDINHVNNLRTNIRSMLQQESELFKARIAKIDEDVTLKEKKLKDECVQDFYNFIKDAKHTFDLAGTVRVEFD
jgi:hypothetical protein